MAPTRQLMKSIHLGDLLESRQALPVEVKAKCYSYFLFVKLNTFFLHFLWKYNSLNIDPLFALRQIETRDR